MLDCLYSYRGTGIRSTFVIRYTRTQWGGAQVRRYVSGLERGIANLAEGRGLFKDMSALYPALRMTRCQDHYVFCLLQQDAPARIVAIFRERMDLMKRLVDRLKE